MLALDKYIGIEFKDLGRTLEEGCDCWGLVKEFYGYEFDITLPDLLGRYDSAMNKKGVSALIDIERKSWNHVNKGDEREGDVIIMRLKGRPWHVGVVLKHKKMLHIHTGCNSVIERYDSTIWERRIYGFVRHKKAPY
jgi:cell wall-associated NlpC family hydrolase